MHDWCGFSLLVDWPLRVGRALPIKWRVHFCKTTVISIYVRVPARSISEIVSRVTVAYKLHFSRLRSHLLINACKGALSRLIHCGVRLAEKRPLIAAVTMEGCQTQ